MKRYAASKWPALMIAAAALLPLAHGGCDSNIEAKKCATADDCSAPYLCCTKGVVLQAEDELGVGATETGTPRCVIPEPTLAFCDVYLPHLVETNPCGRTLVDPSSVFPPPAADQCRAGLECCASTLTCQKEGQCVAPTEEDPNVASTRASCATDEECSGAELCCGISYFDRQGECMKLSDCLATIPTP